jgi:hypothetical protein
MPRIFIVPADPVDTPYPANPRSVTNNPVTLSERIGSSDDSADSSICAEFMTVTFIGCSAMADFA